MAKILIIDDDQGTHDQIDNYLEGVVDKILHSFFPTQGLKLAQSQKPDLILLDYRMPDMNGFQVCLQLKETEITRDIPIIFITHQDNVNLIARALDFGAVDFLTKPFKPVELQARVRSALRTKRFIDSLKLRSRKDTLTDLYNRMTFERALETAVAVYNRDKLPLALLLVAIDHLKELNHTHGHTVGDEIIRSIAETLRKNARPSDTYARFSGARFGVIFRNTKPEFAEKASLQILAGIKELKVPAEKDLIDTTACGGLTHTPESRINIEPVHLTEAAEAGLQKARAHGINLLVINPLEPGES